MKRKKIKIKTWNNRYTSDVKRQWKQKSNLKAKVFSVDKLNCRYNRERAIYIFRVSMEQQIYLWEYIRQIIDMTDERRANTKWGPFVTYAVKNDGNVRKIT